MWQFLFQYQRKTTPRWYALNVQIAAQLTVQQQIVHSAMAQRQFQLVKLIRQQVNWQETFSISLIETSFYRQQSHLRQQLQPPLVYQQPQLLQQQPSQQQFKKILSMTMKFQQQEELQFTRATRFKETVSWSLSFCQFNSSSLLVGDRRLTSRGCAIVHPRKEETCRFHNQGEDPQSCTLCDEHDCNVTDGKGKLFASISLIFALLFIAVRLH